MKNLPILALSATIITAPVFAETTTYPTPSVELSTQFNEATDLRLLLMIPKTCKQLL
ncbi:hypothetical protein [Moraxella nonliquefaciens]|uniref:hypothetical protein n=1 Tax=Moraxella nonliquefaciens TaxID=478 RepID=UPI0024A61E0C|nr:hypothetical protein [Moraxella nonliquefaciens]